MQIVDLVKKTECSRQIVPVSSTPVHCQYPCWFSLQYNAVDTSPVSKYITHPFWNWVVEVSLSYMNSNMRAHISILFKERSSKSHCNYPPKFLHFWWCKKTLTTRTWFAFIFAVLSKVDCTKCANIFRIPIISTAVWYFSILWLQLLCIVIELSKFSAHTELCLGRICILSVCSTHTW